VQSKGRIQVGVVYLGTKGGGNELTKMLCQTIRNWPEISLQSLTLSSSNVQIEYFDDIPVKKIEIVSGVNLESFTRVMKISLQPRKLMALLDLKEGATIVFPMASPLDIPLNISLKIGGVRVIRFLHDAHRHQGDIWPGKLSIWLMQKIANDLVLMSEYVKSLLSQNSQQKGVVIPHPPFDFLSRSGAIDDENYGPYALFIGRIRQYKGLDQLLDAWTSLPAKNNLKLLIAGEGKITRNLPEDVIIKNKWLEEASVVSLIRNAEMVIFPYQEASQSGLIPFAISLGKRIVVTPVGGLVEQVRNYNGVEICQSVESSAIKEGIERALLIDIKSVQRPAITLEWAEQLRILLRK
jgi:glycosyltransferase involved in cell wall biosynthesis